MATRYCVTAGNTSVPANWDGGTLPAAGDDCYADGKAMVIDANFTCNTLRTTNRGGGTTGGSFTISAGGIVLTCSSATQGIYCGAANGCLLITAAAGTVTVNAITIGGTTAAFYGVNISGTCSIVWNNDSIGAPSGTTTGYGMYINANCSLTFNGNATGAASSGIHVAVACTINGAGSAVGSTTATTGYGIGLAATASTVNLTGTSTANMAPGIYGTGAVVSTFIGTATASNTKAAIELTSTSASITMSGSCVNAANGLMAIQCSTIKLYAGSTMSWKFIDEVGGDKYLYSAGVALGNPIEADVRDGTTYGAALELTGTLKVPLPATVALGVPTDNTTGTAVLTASDMGAAVWDYLEASAITPNSFGVRVKGLTPGATAAEVWDYLTVSAVTPGSFGVFVKAITAGGASISDIRKVVMAAQIFTAHR